MILQIKFPDNLVTGSLCKQKDIPCTVQISNKFEILFSIVIPNTIGIVQEWDRQLLEERAIASAGGIYTHNEPALITLSKRTEDSYDIVELSIFYNDFGWCPVIRNKEYAIPNQFWDNDDEDPEYVPKNNLIL